MSAPPPDWYENQHGVLQWWDGKAWGPVRPAEKVEVRPPGPYSVDGVRQWWDGTEWWKREEIADFLTVRATNSQAAGWFRPTNGGVQWWDGARWIPDSEITQILIEDFDASRWRHSTSQAVEQSAQPVAIQTAVRPVQNIHAKPLKSVGVAYVFLIFVGNLGAHRFYIGSPGVAILFILSWAISSFAIVQNVEFGQDPIFTIALIVYIVLFLFDLFALAGKVRRYNARHQFDFR